MPATRKHANDCPALPYTATNDSPSLADLSGLSGARRYPGPKKAVNAVCMPHPGSMRWVSKEKRMVVTSQGPKVAHAELLKAAHEELWSLKN
jgi:hypothetical protein